MKLFHFTCHHGYLGIGRRGELRPMVEHPLLRVKVIWLTSESAPDREATGLTSRFISCDRMAYRYVVTDSTGCRPWLGSPERTDAPADAVAVLEEYGDPEHWWVATDPVKARLG